MDRPATKDVLRVFGHPLHAAMVHFPIGLLGIAPLLDLAGIVLGSPTPWMLGFWTTLLGVVLALLVAVVGVADLLRAIEGDARRTAVWHMVANLGAVVMYAVGLAVRGGPTPASGRAGLIFVSDLAGFGLLAIAGWLGGELVFRHRVGATDMPLRGLKAASTPSSAPRADVHEDAA